ncbi:MAG TPA: chemotaxis protein CheD [Acidobacteriota bacterium]|nr:chemotaxis protein CheD [Acidobacteriota bacterium]
MKQIVGIAEMYVGSSPGDEIITYALGSCLGIAVYDPQAKVGGLLHVMLPLSNIDPDKARHKPCMFVDTGLPLLFNQCYSLGADKSRVVVKVAGGANLRTSGRDSFQIGKRNFAMLRELLRKNQIPIQAQDVGGCCSRTMSLNMADGSIAVRSNGQTNPL